MLAGMRKDLCKGKHVADSHRHNLQSAMGMIDTGYHIKHMYRNESYHKCLKVKRCPTGFLFKASTLIYRYTVHIKKPLFLTITLLNLSLSHSLSMCVCLSLCEGERNRERERHAHTHISHHLWPTENRVSLISHSHTDRHAVSLYWQLLLLLCHTHISAPDVLHLCRSDIHTHISFRNTPERQNGPAFVETGHVLRNRKPTCNSHNNCFGGISNSEQLSVILGFFCLCTPQIFHCINLLWYYLFPHLQVTNYAILPKEKQ